MNPKKYIRPEPDGLHWPDANIGDDLLYGIDFTDYIAESSETITTVIWTLPTGATGITSSDDFLQGEIALIKLATSKIGTYEIVCTLSTDLAGKALIQVVPMMLTVY